MKKQFIEIGTPEIKTILGGVVIHEFLSLNTLCVKVIGVVRSLYNAVYLIKQILMVASGLAVGKEGPMIHIACCIANLIQSRFPKYWQNEALKREVLSASSAAGL